MVILDIARVPKNRRRTQIYESVADMTLTAAPTCDQPNNGSVRPSLDANVWHALAQPNAAVPEIGSAPEVGVDDKCASRTRESMLSIAWISGGCVVV